MEKPTRHRATLLPFLVCSALTAQSVTSPRGFANVEGSFAFAHWGVSRRFQQIDNTLLGTPLVIKSLGWRRNGGTAQTAPARTFDFTVDMGRADFGFLSSLLDNNYLSGTRTNVFTQTAVSFPNWSANLPAPAPFDFVVPLATPYVYVGTSALIIDFVHQNSSVTGIISMDREYNGTTTGSAGVSLNTGCVATGQTAPFTHTATALNLGASPYPAHGLRLLLAGDLAPPAAGVVLAFVDALDRNLTGVLCADLHALPTVLFLLPATAAGAVPEVSIGFAWDASLIGASVYSQLLAVDPAWSPVPLVVSGARRTTIPTSTLTGVHATCYGWYALAGSTGESPLYFGGGAVIQLGL